MALVWFVFRSLILFSFPLVPLIEPSSCEAETQATTCLCLP